MKPNISGGTTLTQTIPGRWWGFFTFLILSLLIALFCFALAPSAADAVTHKLTNPGTGGGTVRWGISGQPWLAGQHLGPGETIDITIGMMDYIYFDASVILSISNSIVKNCIKYFLRFFNVNVKPDFFLFQ